MGSSVSIHTGCSPSLARSSVSTLGSIRESTSTDRPTNAEIATKPWKYVGYKGYADFIAWDNDFYIFRRFTSLNSRIALMLQDQLSVLELQLEDLDQQYSKKEAGDINNGTFRYDQEDRTAILQKVYEKLEKYNNFMIQQSHLKAFQNAYNPDIESLRTWHQNRGGYAIDTNEQEYLNHDHDLFRVVSKDKTPLRRLFERSLTFRIHPLWRKEDPTLPYYDKGLPFETLAATAAYSAVLMVFLQLGNTSSL
ncbi:hypothetical protein F5884DRAFT_682386 [Xylogone sp. PMI_703]|nr:hypothetical protein F5884DRAFT_682386 [Xylogone sp. PMI_703]